MKRPTARGHKYLTLVYQIDAQCTRLLAVVRGVHRHAQDAAVGAQLFVRADPVGVERDQAQVGGAVLGGKRGRDLGGRGGLAHARGADQRVHAALASAPLP